MKTNQDRRSASLSIQNIIQQKKRVQNEAIAFILLLLALSVPTFAIIERNFNTDPHLKLLIMIPVCATFAALMVTACLRGKRAIKKLNAEIAQIA